VGIPQALKIDAAGKAPFDRCLDQLRRKECEYEGLRMAGVPEG
jgi:hypothetical protein